MVSFTLIGVLLAGSASAISVLKHQCLDLTLPNGEKQNMCFQDLNAWKTAIGCIEFQTASGIREDGLVCFSGGGEPAMSSHLLEQWKEILDYGRAHPEHRATQSWGPVVTQTASSLPA